MDNLHIKNLVQVSEHLATAGQPSEQQLRALAERGIEVVINLGLMDPRYCLADERALVAELGLQYYHIPVEFTKPQACELAAFCDVMDAHASQKIFVHCAANYRVTCFVALYGQLRLSWTEQRADTLIRAVWEPDPLWQEFMDTALATSRVGM